MLILLGGCFVFVGLMQGNFGAFKSNNFIVGQRLSPLCVFYDSANIKLELGS